jgi:very-short-patch-repair endonuclease
MRKNLSLPEVLLWQHLRGGRLGWKFRRQHAIGPYFADFYCHELKLILEIDSSWHSGRHEHDARRDEWMKANGYRVLRIPAQAVLRDSDYAAERLKTVIETRFVRSGETEAR